MFGKQPRFSNNLGTWGGERTAKVKTKTSPKLIYKGVHCMFLGYAFDCGPGCYWIWYPEPNVVHARCNII